MNETRTGKYVYVKSHKKSNSFDSAQMSIVIVLISVVILISLWLPAFFANLPLQGV